MSAPLSERWGKPVLNKFGKKIYLDQMTMKEIEERVKENDVIFLPVGSTEAHGPFAPVGEDTIIGVSIAERVAYETGATVAPPIPYGSHLSHHYGMPGTVPVRATTLIEYVADVIRWLSNTGFKKIIVWNSHGQEYVLPIAKLSAGGAIRAACVEGFSVMRPPGHHVGLRGRALGAVTRGFCYINNIAVAVRSLEMKTLILDIDGHHGNGTQEIFEGESGVFYISLHRYPAYPGTGTRSRDNYLNFPLPAECGEELYLRTLRKALSLVDVERFDVVAVSVGFDAHKGDLASLGLTSRSYKRIGRIIGYLDRSTFFVLEGGYHELIGVDALNLMKGFLEARMI